MNKDYVNAKIHMVLVALVLIGAINWGFCAFNINLVKIIADFINNLFKTKLPIENTIYILVAVVAIKLAIDRNTWLPFLGQTVFPHALVPIKTVDKASKTIKVNVTPNTKVAYWGTLDKGNKPDVYTAYSDYSNSGVTISDDKGVAVLAINEGSGYIVPSGRYIKPHVHYRVLNSSGMTGPVETVFY